MIDTKLVSEFKYFPSFNFPTLTLYVLIFLLVCYLTSVDLLIIKKKFRYVLSRKSCQNKSWNIKNNWLVNNVCWLYLDTLNILGTCKGRLYKETLVFYPLQVSKSSLSRGVLARFRGSNIDTVATTVSLH